MDVSRRTAVVTGAASGIGAATAMRLGSAGARVLVVDTDEAGAASIARRIIDGGGQALALRVDVTRADDLQRMLGTAERELGGLDILHNNAGVTAGVPDFVEATPEQWGRVLDVNLRAVITATHLAIPSLRRRGGGAIVHTASMAAFVGFPPDPVYAATKAGVVLFTHSLGPLAAEGIRVNCVCPGLVDTPLLRRSTAGAPPAWLGSVPMLQPDDVADAVMQLITDDTLAGRALQIAVGRREFAPLTPFPAPRR